MYNAKDIAKYIIRRCYEKNYSLSNLKLQKILYFIQAHFLVNYGEPCFDNSIEAWTYGPVVPDVYFEYKKYGAADISGCDDDDIRIDENHKQQLDRMIDITSKYSASKLVEITHKQDPWKNAYDAIDTRIYDDDIMNFYKGK